MWRGGLSRGHYGRGLEKARAAAEIRQLFRLVPAGENSPYEIRLEAGGRVADRSESVESWRGDHCSFRTRSTPGDAAGENRGMSGRVAIPILLIGSRAGNGNALMWLPSINSVPGSILQAC